MQAGSSSEVLKQVDSKVGQDTHAGSGITVDLSYKLFLIEWIRKHRNSTYRLGATAISESILVEHGVYIEADECKSLMKEYAFMFRSGNRSSTVFAAITVGLCIIASSSLFASMFALILFPLVVNFYNEIDVFLRLHFFNPKKLMPSIVRDANALGSTAIVIASRNEPFEVAKMTFDSALALIYPSGKKEIIVVDNSDVTFRDYEKWKNYVSSFELNAPSYVDGVKVLFIHRDGTEGFKPRNLDIALDAVESEFVLYLDVDSTVLEDTLLRITPMFLRDKSIGFVQLHTIPTNAKGTSALALVQGLRNYFLRLETGFYSHISHSMFYGHNAIWRTDVVRNLGSCLEYHNDEVVVTEDLSMTLRASFKGYYGISAWLYSGEWVPESMKETEAMWLRWTVGSYQVYIKHFTKIENLKKLHLREIMGWLQHMGVLVNYGLLPITVACGLAFQSKILMLIVVLSLLPEIIQGISAYSKLSLGEMGAFRKMTKCYSAFLILGAFINWVRCIGLLRYLTGKKQGWTPTGKSGEDKISLASVIKNRAGIMFFGAASSSYATYLLLNTTDGFFNCALVAICGLYGVNNILSVLLFGRSRMRETEESSVGQGDVKDFTNFYLR